MPDKEDVFYHDEAELTWVESEKDCASTLPLPFRLRAFGFLPQCSLKPPVAITTSDLLQDQYMKDGFVTGSEPLLITQPEALRASEAQPGNSVLKLPDFSLAYVKGMGRICSLLELVLIDRDLKLDMQTNNPNLWESLRIVYAHPLRTQSKMQECFKNMHLSSRGAIRTETNLLQLAYMVRNLVTNFGLTDVGHFVRRQGLDMIG